MHHQKAVLDRFPEAQAVEEQLSRSLGPCGKKVHWFIYAGPEPDCACLGTVLRKTGHGQTLPLALCERGIGSDG